MNRSLVSISLASTLALLASSAHAQPLRATLVANVPMPMGAASPPGDNTRLFVPIRTGSIRILNRSSGATIASSFLTVPGVSMSGEGGLLGFAFHPNFATNRTFYVLWTGTNGSQLISTITSYQASAANPNAADAASARTLWRQERGIIHVGGWIGFGQDGFLYVTSGDGVPGDGTQDPDAPFDGKVMRIDVDGPDNIIGNADDDAFPADPDRNYAIPPGNPYAQGPAPETWSFGLRNPYRASFDRQTGEFWLTDVGQERREEINVEAPGQGARNYGWPCFEGSLSYDACDAPSHRPPFYEYPHTDGNAIIGGYVYRGCAIPQLRGVYVYSDIALQSVFLLKRDATGGIAWQVDVGDALGTATPGIAAFGEDNRGEIYLANLYESQLWRLAPNAPKDCNFNGQPDGCEGLVECVADLNGDCGVSIEDLLQYLEYFATGDLAGDMDDGSGEGLWDFAVSIEDLLYYLQRFADGC